MPSAMTDTRLKIIEGHPIGEGLDTFRASVQSVCDNLELSLTQDAIDRLGTEEFRDLALLLLSSLQCLPVAALLYPKSGRGTLQNGLLRLISTAASDDNVLERIKPLFRAAITHDNDTHIWDCVDDAVTESTPSPPPIASSIQQTPWLRNTSSFANSSEHRKYVDDVLKEEFGPLYIGIRDFHKTYFGDVPNLETASKAFFKDCLEGSNPLFGDGWRGWPEEAKQDDVLSWFADFTEKLASFAESYDSVPAYKRRPPAKPNEPIAGFVGKPKMDIGFVDDPSAGKNSRCDWTQILVPGELKSNPSADRPSEAQFDLGRYAREVLAAQDSRRFVLGFTLCGSLMRV
ncbi:hypothetical protein VTK26DRAFT_9081 [Humicola hyalothermophila]